MYKQSNEAKLAYQSAERTLDIVVNVNGVDYKATDIEQFDYDSGGYTGDTFSIGSTYENNITVKFIHLVEGLKRGMIVKPRIGIKLPNGTFEYTPLGVFIIADEIQMDRNNNSTTIKAYDKFVVMEGQYVSKLTYPANAVDIITEIAQMCKVDVNTNDLAHLPTIKVSKAITKQSYRTAIGWIAQLYVGFASFDRDGKLTIRRVAEPNYTIEPSEYEQQGLVKNEAPYIIGGISCNVNVVETTNNGETNETTHKLHSGSVNGSQIELTNDIMTQELLDSIWNSLKTVTFYPFSLNWFGNPAIEAGDWLSLKDMKGNVFVVPNNGYTISFNGGLSSTSKADQNATDSSTVKYTGELTRAIENYSRRQAPDGTNIYTDVKEPTDAKFNDVWFKPNGNSTELWIFERQADGSGKWVRQPVNGEVDKKINDALKDFDELDKSFKDNANTQSATNELMKSRIDSISNQIPNLSDEISRVNGSVISLKTQTDKDRQQLQTTSQNLDQARQDVLSNSSRIDKLSVGLDSVNINVNNVNSKVDSIKVGGTNLVRNSAHDPSSLDHWTTNGVGKIWYVTHLFFRNGTTKMFFLNNPNTNQEMLIQTEYMDIEPDTDYTLSMVIFGASGVSSGDVYYNIKYADGSNTYFNIDRAFKYNPYHAERKVYKFHTSPNSSGSKATQVFVRVDNNGLIPGYSDATSMLGDVKLEKGNVATDWSPAPEDEIERVAQLRVDLDGINATVATNKGDIAQIKLTENGMQQSIKDAQGNISTLQNDSKQFKQQFQDVNGNITTIKNDAKSLSSQLSTKVGTSEYNSFKEQTAQELRTKLTASDLSGYAKSVDVKVSVDGLNARFDNLNVGGTNLLQNSGNLQNTDGWSTNGSHAILMAAKHPYWKNNQENLFLLINKSTNGSEAIFASGYIKVERNTNYTLSYWAFEDSHVPNSDTWFLGRKNGETSSFTTTKQLVSKRKYSGRHAEYISVTFNTDESDEGYIRFDNNGNNGNQSGLYIANIKLEKGTIATDWSPAPEDTDNKIEILSGKITANSNEFSTVYSKITNVQNVANSTGGGINLAKHTSNKLANVTASPWLYVGGGGSSSFNNLKDYQGKYMTVRVWIEKPSRDTWVRIWTDKGVIEGNVIKAGQSGYSTVSGVIPTGFSAWNIPIGNNNNGTTFGWKEFKIELGNVATPWSPNPDDVDSNIDTAANNARTNAKNDAINAIKGDSQWQSMGKIVTNAAFLQNSDGFAQEVSKRIVGSTGQTNLYYNSEFAYSNGNNHNVDGITSTGNIAYSVNGRYVNYRGSNSMYAHTTGGMTDYKYIEHTKDNYVKVSPGEIVSASVTVWTTGDRSTPRDGYAICTISFYKDLNSSRMGYKEVSVAAKDMAYPNYKTLKVENVTVPSGANYMILHLIVRGAADWHFSQPMLVKDDHVGVYVPSTQLQLNQVIDTADSHTRTISDYLTGSNSRFVQMANYLNMNVKNSSVSINGDGVMLSGNRIKITGKTLIDNAVILDALIKDINANTVKTKTLDASKINVTNLNANNITTGTLSGPNFSLNLDKGNMKIGIADKSKSIVLDNGKIDLYSSDVLSSSDYVGTITTVKGGPVNHAIRIAGNDGFLIGTEDFTNNFFADGGYSWGTTPSNYISGAGIFGHNQNLTIAAGPTRDHNTLAMVAGAIPSTDLGNIFGARAQPGFYVYGRDEAHKDLSFSAAVAPLGVTLSSSYGSIKVGNTSITAGTDKTDTSLSSSEISLELYAPNNKIPGLTIKPTYITLGELADGLGGLGNPEIGLNLDDKRISLTADNISILANKELSLSNIETLNVKNSIYTNYISTKNLYVSGSKNAVVPSSKGYIAINAYETAEYYFGDIGENQTDKQGVKIINLDPLFLETVNTNVPYQVFLSSYDDAKVWVFARNNNMFIVKSDKPNVKFAWEIKAKRKDYENVRLKTVNYKGERN